MEESNTDKSVDCETVLRRGQWGVPQAEGRLFGGASGKLNIEICPFPRPTLASGSPVPESRSPGAHSRRAARDLPSPPAPGSRTRQMTHFRASRVHPSKGQARWRPPPLPPLPLPCSPACSNPRRLGISPSPHPPLPRARARAGTRTPRAGARTRTRARGGRTESRRAGASGCSLESRVTTCFQASPHTQSAVSLHPTPPPTFL